MFTFASAGLQPRVGHTCSHGRPGPTRVRAKPEDKNDGPPYPAVSKPVASPYPKVEPAAAGLEDTEAAQQQPSEVKQKRRRLAFSHRLNESFGTDELIEELREKDGLGKRGEVVLVAQLILTFLVIVPPLRLQGLVYLSGMLAVVAGLVSFIYSIICLGKSFSPLVAPRRNNELITSGMFQYMRHPLYSGMILIGFGMAAITYSETRLLMAYLLSQVLNYKARLEEAALLEKHGEVYETYMRSVKRFVPTLT